MSQYRMTAMNLDCDSDIGASDIIFAVNTRRSIPFDDGKIGQFGGRA